MRDQSSGKMEQWKDRGERNRLEGMRDSEGFRAWQAEARHGQFVTRSGAMAKDGDSYGATPTVSYYTICLPEMR